MTAGLDGILSEIASSFATLIPRNDEFLDEIASASSKPRNDGDF